MNSTYDGVELGKRIIDVFVDLENVVHQKNPGKFFHAMENVLRGIGVSLRDMGFTVNIFQVFASSAKFRVGRSKYTGAQRIASKCGAQMMWCSGLADDALIRAIERRIADATISDYVLLVTGDKHFARVTRLLRKHGKVVWVCGAQVSKVLQECADRVFTLESFLTGYDTPPDGTQEPPPPPINPFPLK